MLTKPILLVHAAFEWAGMLAGARLYMQSRNLPSAAAFLGAPNFAVLVGCLVGAAIGNKAAFWIEMPHLWDASAGWAQLLKGGQSMVGGLLGGLAGVEVAKKIAGVAQSTGDAFVFPILLGLMIGRIGCFLAGLQDQTYGIATDLPWGVDFGDGVRRHPTQIYEILWAMTMWRLLSRWRTRLVSSPGLMFKMLLTAYLVWRLLADSLKPVPYAWPMGLSGIQWVCLVALAGYLPTMFHQLRLTPLRDRS